MKATLTELRRDTGKILGLVIHGNETVELTQHGETVAEIRPKKRGMSAEDFARIWDARVPLAENTASEVARNLKEIDSAK